MTHQKRLSAPKHYPIDKKDQTYITTSNDSRSPKISIPTVLFLREVTNYADTKKEARKIVKNGQIERNNQTIRSVEAGLATLDKVHIEENEETYRVINQKDNIKFQPVQGDAQVIAKITDKAPQQDEYIYRLHNGENIQTSEEFDTESTAIIEDGEIKEEIPLEEDQEALVIKGKHAGKTATINKIRRQGRNPDAAELENNEEEFQTRLENLVAIKTELQGVEQQ